MGGKPHFFPLLATVKAADQSGLLMDNGTRVGVDELKIIVA
ncbi:hypothetical protein [Mesorhizobium kowhaii]|nr:hypothetical protein [Mesorhizobium kowhaii]